MSDRFTIVFVVVVLVGSIAFMFHEGRRAVNCREEPARAHELQQSFIVAGSSSVWVCGKRERAALSTVLQCYDMQPCSEP